MKYVKYMMLFVAVNASAMQNQVVPIAQLSEADLVAKVLADITTEASPAINQELQTYIANAAKKKNQTDVEMGTGAQILLEAANTALNDKNVTHMSKTTSGLITAGTSITVAIITAIAAHYSK
jgi:hypothetical protein